MAILMKESHVEVLVIGAGPTGLFFAGELARHGVSSRIIDQNLSPHTQTRATEIQPAVLEVLHRAGMAEKIMESSLPMQGLRILDAHLKEAYVFSIPPADSQFPTTRSLPQWRTEEILCENLKGYGIDVERGVTALEITMSGSGARVLCSDHDGAQHVIHADYLVGAGGAHSPVRGSMHKNLEGITYPRRYLVADVDAQGLHKDGHLISVAIAATGLVMVIELPNGRSLVLTDLLDGAQTTHNVPGLEEVNQAVAAHLHHPLDISDVRWASVYRMHRRMSPKFSGNRCFLAGDSAHLCSPLGGEGLNAGILDGASLAWMLAAVLRRGGKPGLLEAYEPERQEIARQVLTSSDAMHDYYDVLVNMAAEGKPLTEPPDDPTRKVTSGSMVDLTLSDSPILGCYGSVIGVQKMKPGCRFPKRILLGGCLHHLLVYSETEWGQADFSTRWAKVLTVLDGNPVCPPSECGIGGCGAVLVRPDGYVGFVAYDWNPEAREALDRLLCIQFTP